jgi:hypothetical protein
MVNYFRFSQTGGAFVYDAVENTVTLDLDLLISKLPVPAFAPLTAATLGADPFVEPVMYQILSYFMENQSFAADATLIIGAPVAGDNNRRWNPSISEIIRDGVQTPVKLYQANIQLMQLLPRMPNPNDLI